MRDAGRVAMSFRRADVVDGVGRCVHCGRIEGGGDDQCDREYWISMWRETHSEQMYRRARQAERECHEWFRLGSMRLELA